MLAVKHATDVRRAWVAQRTEFPNLNLTVAPLAGQLLIFHNTYVGTETKHPLALHAGSPVGQMGKWAFNCKRDLAQRHTMIILTLRLPYTDSAPIVADTSVVS